MSPVFHATRIPIGREIIGGRFWLVQFFLPSRFGIVARQLHENDKLLQLAQIRSVQDQSTFNPLCTAGISIEIYIPRDAIGASITFCIYVYTSTLMIRKFFSKRHFINRRERERCCRKRCRVTIFSRRESRLGNINMEHGG